jgi:hypothetical protein
MMLSSNLNTQPFNLSEEERKDFVAHGSHLKCLIQISLRDKLLQLPQKLRDFTVENCMLAGGSISSIYHGEEVNDFDLWLKDLSKMEELRKLTTEYIGNGVPLDETPYAEAFVDGKIETPRAITLSNRLQYIIYIDFLTAKNIFDYVHCQVNYDLKTETLYMSPRQFYSIMNKKLVINEISSITPRREMKYSDKGWRM